MSAILQSTLALAFVATVLGHEGTFLDGYFTKPNRVNTTNLDPYYNSNPIGLAIVPQTKGRLYKGDVLVTNYADESGNPGTGFTITRVETNGMTSTFVALAQAPTGCGSAVGFTAGICITNSGYILASSTPAINGSYSSQEPGCIVMFDYDGEVVTTFYGNHIRGPWNMACAEDAAEQKLYVFVAAGLPDVYEPPFDVNAAGLNQNGQWQMYQQAATNVNADKSALRQSGSVAKLVLSAPQMGVPQLLQSSYIANNFFWSDVEDKQLGPGGLAVVGRDLYISEPFTNSIWVSWGAAAAPTTSSSPQLVCNKAAPNGSPCPDLDSPLGLGAGPQGQLLVVNGGNSTLVELHNGKQVNAKFIDVEGMGVSFVMYGIAVGQDNRTYITGIASDYLLELGTPTAQERTNFAGR